LLVFEHFQVIIPSNDIEASDVQTSELATSTHESTPTVIVSLFSPMPQEFPTGLKAMHTKAMRGGQSSTSFVVPCQDKQRHLKQRELHQQLRKKVSEDDKRIIQLQKELKALEMNLQMKEQQLQTDQRRAQQPQQFHVTKREMPQLQKKVSKDDKQISQLQIELKALQMNIQMKEQQLQADPRRTQQSQQLHQAQLGSATAVGSASASAAVSASQQKDEDISPFNLILPVCKEQVNILWTVAQPFCNTGYTGSLQYVITGTEQLDSTAGEGGPRGTCIVPPFNSTNYPSESRPFIFSGHDNSQYNKMRTPPSSSPASPDPYYSSPLFDPEGFASSLNEVV